MNEITERLDKIIEILLRIAPREELEKTDTMNRFTDNGDGTVRDNETGLTWLKDANKFDTRMEWGRAIEMIKSVSVGDMRWRLPTRVELFSLMDDTQYDPALPTGHPFENVRSDTYWSSSTYAYYTSSAWGVFMGNGGVYGYNKSNDFYVWPVRSDN